MNDRNAVFELGDAEGVVGVNEHFNDSLERLKATAKAAASAGQDRDIVPQIGVDALDVVGVALIVNIAHMIAGEHHVEVAIVTVRVVKIGLRRAVYDALNVCRALVHGDLNPNNHAGFRLMR